MLAVLLMAHVWPARESTGAILPVLITADVIAVKVFHRHANARLVLRLLPSALVGIVCGWWLMPRVEASMFGMLIGWLAVGLTALVIVQKMLPAVVVAAEKRRFSWPLGWTAGVTTMLANAAGPVTTIYLLACRLPKLEFVGTSAWFYLVVNVAKVPFSASLGLITPSTLLLNAMLIPVIVVGVFVARWVLERVNQGLFEWLMIAFTLGGAVKLIVG